jgi:hypothetical protein
VVSFQIPAAHRTRRAFAAPPARAVRSRARCADGSPSSPVRGTTRHLVEQELCVTGRTPQSTPILWIPRWTTRKGPNPAAGPPTAADPSSATANAIKERSARGEQRPRRAMPCMVPPPIPICPTTSMDAHSQRSAARNATSIAPITATPAQVVPARPRGTVPFLSSRPVDWRGKGFHKLWITSLSLCETIKVGGVPPGFQEALPGRFDDRGAAGVPGRVPRLRGCMGLLGFSGLRDILRRFRGLFARRSGVPVERRLLGGVFVIDPIPTRTFTHRLWRVIATVRVAPVKRGCDRDHRHRPQAGRGRSRLAARTRRTPDSSRRRRTAGTGETARPGSVAMGRRRGFGRIRPPRGRVPRRPAGPPRRRPLPPRRRSLPAAARTRHLRPGPYTCFAQRYAAANASAAPPRRAVRTHRQRGAPGLVPLRTGPFDADPPRPGPLSTRRLDRYARWQTTDLPPLRCVDHGSTSLRCVAHGPTSLRCVDHGSTSPTLRGQRRPAVFHSRSGPRTPTPPAPKPRHW